MEPQFCLSNLFVGGSAQYNRTGQGSQCNQAIMLITAGPVLASYTTVLKHYNWPHMPVRMFTYLIGKDSSTASELNKIACGNKGADQPPALSESLAWSIASLTDALLVALQATSTA